MLKARCWQEYAPLYYYCRIKLSIDYPLEN